jgi:ring-1,2-phenylacetyl-CoA epoxidase subunit PaaE
MKNDSFRLTVQSVRRPTPSSVELTFAQPPAPLHYRAGQYLTFEVVIDGRTYPRAYSLVGSPGRGDPLSIIVKRTAGGVVSNHLHEGAAPGLTLKVSGPQGRFCVEPRVGGRHAVLIGGGSGITPLHAIARELLHSEPETTIALLYCNVAVEEIILRDELDRLVEESGGRLRVVHVLERDAAPTGALPGRLDVSRSRTLLGELSWGKQTEFYVCGPEGLMEVVREALRALSIPPERVFQEHFTRPDDAGEGEAQVVSVQIDGKEYPVPVPAGATILDAALSAGVPIESSCRVGDCGTCKLRRLCGEVHQSRVEGLSPEEEAAGYVLTCVSHPRSPGVVLAGP